jgi:uncharacterized protein
MLYRQLKNTGIDLSILGFGCMRLPTTDNKPNIIDYHIATQMLHYAIDQGVNYVDTAYFYHSSIFGQMGESEPFLGEALSGGLRKKIYLATKMPVFLLKQKEQMDTFLIKQLERLRTDYLDFYLLHGINGESWDRMKDLGVREFMDKKKAEGKFRFPAFSFHGKVEDFMRICDEYNWTLAQVQYNYLDTNFQAGSKGIEYANEKGIGVVVMEPLKGGKLGNRIPSEMSSVINSFPIKKSPAEWALRFVWNESRVLSLLSGMNSMEQVVENINIASNALPDSLTNDELLMYDKLRGAVSTKIKADCTDCRYCMPCSSGVDIPDVLASLNQSAVWNETNAWPTGYVSIKGKAGKCTECRECEEVCPQELPISALMKEAVAIFKG